MARPLGVTRWVRTSRAAACGVLVSLLLAPAVARGQAVHFAPYPELRADVIAAPHTQVTGGGGVEILFGAYVRLGVDASAGAVWNHGSALAAGRADLITRFLLDPFREVPIALSLGAGLTLPVQQGAGPVRPLLAAVVDVEGRRKGAWTPALQFGVGGGVRVGFALRRSPRATR